jgi:hypothetical protein
MKEIFSVTVPVAAIAGTVNQPLWRVPTGASAASHGGITLQNAYMICSGAATSVLSLYTGTALGTAVTGTAGTLNGTFTANVPIAFTLGTSYVGSGKWVLLGTGAGGSLATTNVVVLEYIWGK